MTSMSVLNHEFKLRILQMNGHPAPHKPSESEQHGEVELHDRWHAVRDYFVIGGPILKRQRKQDVHKITAQ